MKEHKEDFDYMEISLEDSFQGSENANQAKPSANFTTPPTILSPALVSSPTQIGPAISMQQAAFPNVGSGNDPHFAERSSSIAINYLNDAISEKDESKKWFWQRKARKGNKATELEDMKSYVQDLQQSNQRKETRLKDHEYRAGIAENRVANARFEAADLRTKLNDASRRYKNFEADQRKKQKEDLTKIEKKYERKIEELEAQNWQLQQEQEQRIRSAQDAAATMMKVVKSGILSDEAIEKFFGTQASKWQKWVDNHAHKDPFILSHDNATFLQAVENCTPGKDHLQLGELLQGQKAKNSPSLLLQALLAHFMCIQIISKPFWIADAMSLWFSEHPEDQQRMSMAKSVNSEHIESVLVLLSKIRSNEAQAWRVQTAQILYTAVQEAFKTEPHDELSALLQMATNLYRENLTEQFLNGAAKELLKPTEPARDDRTSSLRELIQTCLHFSTQLWSQKSLPQTHGPVWFKERKFHHTDPLTKLHRSQDLKEFCIDPDNDEEDNENLYNSLPIALLIQPAIVAYGNEQGENYESRTRVWSPAIVWVSGTRQRHHEKREEIAREKVRREEEEKLREQEREQEMARREQESARREQENWGKGQQTKRKTPEPEYPDYSYGFY